MSLIKRMAPSPVKPTMMTMIFVVFKMDSVTGHTLWVSQQPTFNTPIEDLQPSIATDPSGYIYVAYQTQGGTASGQTRTGLFDIVVFKLEPTAGQCLWVVQQPTFNGTISNTQPSLVIGMSGNLYCTYQIFGTVSGQIFDGGLSNIVVFKLEPMHGTCLWVVQNPTFNTSGTDTNPQIALDADDYIYVAYQTDGVASGQAYLGGTHAIVVFKLEPVTGQTLWVREQINFNTTADDLRPSIAVNSSGYPYISYYTTGTISGQTNTGQDDIVIFKMSPDGTCLWVNQLPVFNTTLADIDPQIIVDPAGDLDLVYQTDGIASGQTLTGSSDIVVCNMTPPTPSIQFTSYFGTTTDPVPLIRSLMSYTLTINNNGGLPVYGIIFNDASPSNPVNLGTLLPN